MSSPAQYLKRIDSSFRDRMENLGLSRSFLQPVLHLPRKEPDLTHVVVRDGVKHGWAIAPPNDFSDVQRMASVYFQALGAASVVLPVVNAANAIKTSLDQSESRRVLEKRVEAMVTEALLQIDHTPRQDSRDAAGLSPLLRDFCRESFAVGRERYEAPIDKAITEVNAAVRPLKRDRLRDALELGVELTRFDHPAIQEGLSAPKLRIFLEQSLAPAAMRAAVLDDLASNPDDYVFLGETGKSAAAFSELAKTRPRAVAQLIRTILESRNTYGIECEDSLLGTEPPESFSNREAFAWMVEKGSLDRALAPFGVQQTQDLGLG